MNKRCYHKSQIAGLRKPTAEVLTVESVTHPPLTLNVHIGHKAPGHRKEREQSPGCCRTTVDRGRRACRHGDHVHGSDSASTEQKAAVQKEGLPKAHVIPDKEEKHPAQ